MTPIQRILCPTDFSGESLSAIEFVMNLSGGRPMELHLVHVLEIPVFIDSYGLMYFDQIYQQARKNSEEKMSALVQEMSSKYPENKVEFDIIDGQDSAESLIEYVKKHSIDLIALSSHGRKGLQRLLMGSVAESLMRMSPVPVVVYKGLPSDKK